jgi:hypothetical protein
MKMRKSSISGMGAFDFDGSSLFPHPEGGGKRAKIMDRVVWMGREGKTERPDWSSCPAGLWSGAKDVRSLFYFYFYNELVYLDSTGKDPKEGIHFMAWQQASQLPSLRKGTKQSRTEVHDHIWDKTHLLKMWGKEARRKHGNQVPLKVLKSTISTYTPMMPHCIPTPKRQFWTGYRLLSPYKAVNSH